MNTNTTIKVTCPSCGDVDLDGIGRVRLAATTAAPTAVFVCNRCRWTRTREVTNEQLSALIGAGATGFASELEERAALAEASESERAAVSRDEVVAALRKLAGARTPGQLFDLSL